MLTFAQLWKEIKDPIISMIPGILALFEFNSGLIFIVSSLTGVISKIIEYIYERLFCKNLENEYNASIEVHKYNERKSLNQIYRVVNWYIIRGINNSSIKVQRLVCNESSILDDDYIIRDEAVFHADYTIVPDEDYYVDIHWKDKKFQANHYITGAKQDNPVYKIYGFSIDELKEFQEYCLVEHREYSKKMGKDVYKYFEWDMDDDEWCKRDIETEKTFDNIFIPREHKEDIISKIDIFVKSKENYKKWGIPYKLGFVFHGHPGCGKTSTIYAIANHLGRSIYLLKLDTFETNSDLYRAARHIPRDAIVVIEDIDAHRVAHSRRPVEDANNQNKRKIPIIIRRKDNNHVNGAEAEADTISAYSEAIDDNTKELKTDIIRQGDDDLTDDYLTENDGIEVTEGDGQDEEEGEEEGVGEGDEELSNSCKDEDKMDEMGSESGSGGSKGSKSKEKHNDYRSTSGIRNTISEEDDDDISGMSRTGRIYHKPKSGKGKTIDSLLEIFDGYNYLPGAIVIITTNHLDAIDSALVRPGRMDHHYLFNYAIPETINDILDFFYEKASIESFDPGYIVNAKNVKDMQIDFSKHLDSSGQIRFNKLTTAEIINSIILPNIRDRKKTLAILEDKLFSVQK